MHSLAVAGRPASPGAGADPLGPGPGSWDPVLEVDVQALVPRLGALPDEMNPILRLVDGRRTAAEIVREGAGRDPAAPGRVEALRRQGILRVVGGGEPAVDPGTIAPPREITDWFVPPEGARGVAAPGATRRVTVPGVEHRGTDPGTATPGGARWVRVAFPLVALGLVGLAVAAAVTLTRRTPSQPATPAPALETPATVRAPSPADVTAPAPPAPGPAAPPFAERVEGGGTPPPVAGTPLAAPPTATRRAPATSRSPATDRAPAPKSPPARARPSPASAAPTPSAPRPTAARPTAAEAAATYRQALADGQGNMERGAHLAAVADYRRALSARSTGEAWFGLGQALAEAGRPDEARQAFRRSLEVEPQGSHAGEAVRAMLRLR